MGAALLVAGSLAYSGYCALAVQRSAAEDLASNQLYLISSLLWLLGTAFLIHSSYPERVAGVVTQAERDARDPSRIAAMGALERYRQIAAGLSARGETGAAGMEGVAVLRNSLPG